jgi:hypothetical protein
LKLLVELYNGGGVVPAREVSSYADHALDVGDEASVGGQLERTGEEAAGVLHLPFSSLQGSRIQQRYDRRTTRIL